MPFIPALPSLIHSRRELSPGEMTEGSYHPEQLRVCPALVDEHEIIHPLGPEGDFKSLTSTFDFP